MTVVWNEKVQLKRSNFVFSVKVRFYQPIFGTESETKDFSHQHWPDELFLDLFSIPK